MGSVLGLEEGRMKEMLGRILMEIQKMIRGSALLVLVGALLGRVLRSTLVLVLRLLLRRKGMKEG